MRIRAHDLTQARALVSERKEAMRETVRQCQAGRIATKARLRELRRKTNDDVRASIERAKLAARDACRLRKAGAKARGTSRTERAKDELRQERQFQRELHRAEGRARRREALRNTRAERRQESDDEVRRNLDPEHWAVFDQVRRSIKGTPYMSRTEAFLHWIEENPDAVLRARGARRTRASKAPP